MSNHQFLQTIPLVHNCRAVRDVALDLMNFFFRQDLSRNKWMKQPRHTVTNESIIEGT